MPSFSLKRTVLSLAVSLTENYLRYLYFSILRKEKHSDVTAGTGAGRCNSKLWARKTMRTNFFPDFCALSNNSYLDFKFLEIRDIIFFVSVSLGQCLH